MIRNVLLGMFLSALLVSPLRAEDGHKLKEQCAAKDQTACTQYIAGVVGAVLVLNPKLPSGVWCPPEGTKLEQYVWPTTAFLMDRSEQLDRDAAEIVITAVRKAFPCEADRQRTGNTLTVVMRAQDAAAIQSAINTTLGPVPSNRSQRSDGTDGGNFAFSATAVAKDDKCSTIHLEGNFVGNLTNRIVIDGLYCMKSGQAGDWETRSKILKIVHPHS